MLKCVMFRSKAVNLRFQPQNGDTVVAVGRLAVYERDGVYQLYTDLLLQQGVGDLMQAYEKLKQKLERAGLLRLSVNSSCRCIRVPWELLPLLQVPLCVMS